MTRETTMRTVLTERDCYPEWCRWPATTCVLDAHDAYEGDPVTQESELSAAETTASLVAAGYPMTAATLLRAHLTRPL